jgi:hypothetical protein
LIRICPKDVDGSGQPAFKEDTAAARRFAMSVMPITPQLRNLGHKVA